METSSLSSSIKPLEIHISKTDNHYYFIVEDPSNPIISFKEKIPIPSVSRKKIMKTLTDFLISIGVFRGPRSKSKLMSPLAEHEILKKLGQSIFKLMLPESCRCQLREIQSEYVIISTEDVELPWELMYDGEEFFCLKYSVGRKIQARIPIKKINRPNSNRIKFLFISNPTLNLPNADEEVKRIVNFLEDAGNVDIAYLSGEDATVEAIIDILENEYFDVIHYAGHAIFNAKDPAQSKILLNDEALSAAYLLNIISTPPRMVFMNACESAIMHNTDNMHYYLEYGGKLTGLASAFIAAGVDAYIGTLWSVVDEISADIAIKFYDLLLNGETIGKALRIAKLEVKRKYNDLFTWAAFILYGDPTSKIYFVDKKTSLAKMLYQKGIEYYKMCKFDTALEYFNEALKINPEYIDALIARGLVLVILNKNEEAVESLNLALKINPASYSIKISDMKEMFNRAHFYHIYSSTQKRQAEFLIFLMKQYASYFSINPRLILDLGCGTGTLTKYIWKEHFPWAKVVGIDISENMIKKAVEELPEGYNVEYICADIKEFDYPNKFDIVYSNSTMHWIVEQDVAYRNIHRLMADKSILVVHQGHKGCYKELRDVAMEVLEKLGMSEKFKDFKYPLVYHTKSSIKDLLERSGFKLVQTYVVETGVTETLVDDFVEAGLLPYRKLLTKEEDAIFVKEFKKEARKLQYINTTRLYFVAMKND